MPRFSKTDHRRQLEVQLLPDIVKLTDEDVLTSFPETVSFKTTVPALLGAVK